MGKENSDFHLTAELLDEAAAFARSQPDPVRVWRRRGERIAEIYFQQDMVIHAACARRIGMSAVQLFVTGPRTPLRIEAEQWPDRYTLLLGWPALRYRILMGSFGTSPDAEPDDQEKTARLMGSFDTSPDAEYDDQEKTANLGPAA